MARRLDDVNPIVMQLKNTVAGLLPEDRAFDFEVCAVEALVNTVRHADCEPHDAAIDLTLSYGPKKIALEIFDAKASDPCDPMINEKALGDVDLMDENGRGLGLIRHCADVVDYGPTNGRNRLKMSFNINSAA